MLDLIEMIGICLKQPFLQTFHHVVIVYKSFFPFLVIFLKVMSNRSSM